MPFRGLKNVGFANLEDIFHSYQKKYLSYCYIRHFGRMSLRHLLKQTLRHFQKGGSKAIEKLVICY